MTNPDAGSRGTGISDERHRRRRVLWAVVVIAVLAAAGGAVLAIADPFAGRGPAGSSATGVPDPTSLATATREDLSSQTQVPATLGYSGDDTVVNQAPGTVTSLPAAGQTVSEGQVLYRVDGAPVVLLYGTTPAYRPLAESVSTAQTGPDVAELNADLVALGYATSAEIPAGSDEFTRWTADAVDRLQAGLGVTETGTLALGQAAFEPTAVRIASVVVTLGAPAQPGQPVLTATSTARQVSIALDADQQTEVAAGDRVTITLPDNRTTPGVVSSVGTVATTPQGGGSSTITVLVNPTDPTATGTWDQAPVNVTITTGSVSDALVVPVDALLARAGGGYAVEVAIHRLRRLVPVALGLFDDADGLVQVTGTRLTAGQRIVVPNL